MFDKKLDLFIKKYPVLEKQRGALTDAYRALVKCYESGGKALVCGNGGSAADSEHIVGELMKGFNKKRPLNEAQKKLFADIPGGSEAAEKLQNALPAISLVSQSGIITAFANDVDPALIFAQQVWGYGKKGDILIALSTSGKSENVVLAAATAKAVGMTVLSITGEKASQLSEISDICLRLPADSPKDVQELTLPVYHLLCELTEDYFFDE